MSAGSAAERVAPAVTPRRVTSIRPPSLTLDGLLSDVAKLIIYRDLLLTLSVHRIKVRYKQSALGVAWAIVQPLSLMLIYTFIFSFIVKMPTNGTAYPLFAYSGLLPWTFFSTALGNATNGLVSHAQLITKVYFPREILPITYVVAALFDLCVASIVFVILMLVYDAPFTGNIVYLIPITIVLAMFATAVSLIFSATQVRFRDIGVAIPLLLQLWMFATPVVYPLDAVPDRVRQVYLLNPMVGFVETWRQVTVGARPPDLHLLALATAVSTVLLVAAYVYFKHREATIADVI